MHNLELASIADNNRSETSRSFVMHLIDTAGPGGAETIFAQLAARIGSGAYDAVPIVPREDWLSGQLRSAGLSPLILNAKGSLNWRYLRKLVAIIRERNVRLIHTHLLGSAVYGAMAGLMTHTPVIAVMHGPTDLRTIGKFAFVKRWLIKNGCQAIVAVSTSTRDALLEFGIQPERVMLIQNGVDTELYSPGQAKDLRAELGLPSDDLLVGAVGNIRTPKAYDVLLQAAARVLERVPKAYFVVIGEGNEQQLAPLLALRTQLGLDNRFRFLGFRKSASALFHNFDVFVSSSRTEGLSLSFLEAMATGRAIVASRSGGAQEAIHAGESGLLVPIENPVALGEALIQVLLDAGLRNRLGATARARAVRDFSLNANIHQYETLYSRYLG